MITITCGDTGYSLKIEGPRLYGIPCSKCDGVILSIPYHGDLKTVCLRCGRGGTLHRVVLELDESSAEGVTILNCRSPHPRPDR